MAAQQQQFDFPISTRYHEQCILYLPQQQIGTSARVKGGRLPCLPCRACLPATLAWLPVTGMVRLLACPAALLTSHPTPPTLPHLRRYAGTWDAIRRIWAEEGPGGYFKGMRAKILQTALNAALMLMIKEQVRRGTRLSEGCWALPAEHTGMLCYC